MSDITTGTETIDDTIAPNEITGKEQVQENTKPKDKGEVDFLSDEE